MKQPVLLTVVVQIIGWIAQIASAECPSPSLWAAPFNTTHVRLQWQAEWSRPFSLVQNFAVGIDGGAAAGGLLLPATATEAYAGGMLEAGQQVQCTVLASCVDGSKAASSTVATESMAAEAVPTAPTASVVNVGETELTVQWRVFSQAFSEGITRFTLNKDGVEAKQLNLNLQLQPDAAGRGGAAMQVTVGSLRAGVEYTLALVAHNWYGSSTLEPFTATTKAKSCGSVDCGSPAACTGGESLSSTTLPGRCCPITFCACDVQKCPAPPATCTAEEAALTTAVDGQCCPEHACVPWEETCDVAGSGCTCPAGRAGRKCELGNPNSLPCGVGCGTCDESNPSISCTACTDSLYLLDGFCHEACPQEGYEAAGAWAPDGRRCQLQLPCPFQSVGGDFVEYPHKSTWCDGTESVCFCDAGKHSCRDHACENGGAVEITTTTAPVGVTAAATTASGAGGAATTVDTKTTDGQSTATLAIAAATTAAAAGTSPLMTATSTADATTANPAGVPVDGGWSKWSGYGACAPPVEGTPACYEVRTRACSEPWPQNNGLPCDGKDKQSRSCSCPSQGAAGEQATTPAGPPSPPSPPPPGGLTTTAKPEASEASGAGTSNGGAGGVATEAPAGSSNGEGSDDGRGTGGIGAGASNGLATNTADGADGDAGNSGAQQDNSTGGGGGSGGGSKMSPGAKAAVALVVLCLLGGAGFVAFRIYRKRRQDAYNLDAYFVGRQEPPRRSVSGDYTPKLNADALSPAARVLEDKHAMQNLQQQSSLAAAEADAAAVQVSERRAAAAVKLAPQPTRRVVSVQSVAPQPEVTLLLDTRATAEAAPPDRVPTQGSDEEASIITVRPAGAPVVRKNLWAQEAEC